jgi:serine/threonine-protein kinase
MTDLDLDAVAPPRIVGRYALFDEIAAGGMATVHLGRLVGQVGFSRTVAVKRLHPQYAKDHDFVSMFVDEAKLASRIQHPNVVSTLDVVKTDDELFLVMEYVQGEALSKLVRHAARSGERIPLNIVLSVMSGMLHGLHAAHEAKSENREPLNLVHRDISPQNVHVGIDGVARVLDFGVAKAQVRSGATKDGQMKGKLSYMSPEQLNGHEVDRRSDVFSAGIVLWEALAGKRLFAGSDTGEILAKVLRSEIPNPQSFLPDLPETVSDVVMKALQRDASKRFQTARDFAVALEQAAPGATAHLVGEWVRENGGEELAERANLVALVESHPMDGLDEISSRIEAVRGRPSFPFLDPASPAPEEGAFGAGILQRDEGWVRRRIIAVGLLMAAGAGFYWVLRPRVGTEIQEARPVVTTTGVSSPRPGLVNAPSPTTGAASTPATALTTAAAVTGLENPSPPPAPAPRWRPSRPTEKNCNPPFTIDADGIKKPKLHCLGSSR